MKSHRLEELFIDLIKNCFDQQADDPRKCIADQLSRSLFGLSLEDKRKQDRKKINDKKSLKSEKLNPNHPLDLSVLRASLKEKASDETTTVLDIVRRTIPLTDSSHDVKISTSDSEEIIGKNHVTTLFNQNETSIIADDNSNDEISMWSSNKDDSKTISSSDSDESPSKEQLMKLQHHNHRRILDSDDDDSEMLTQQNISQQKKKGQRKERKTFYEENGPSSSSYVEPKKLNIDLFIK